MNITPIRTKADHKAALKTIESLMSAKANTPEGDRLDVLVTLVEAYERGMPAASLLKQSNGKAS
jgi:HTH-type transcriptional regulator/antitoxin HigA